MRKNNQFPAHPICTIIFRLYERFIIHTSGIISIISWKREFYIIELYIIELKGGMCMAKERIHNPKTHSDSRIRQRTTKKGKKGQIMGKYHK